MIPFPYQTGQLGRRAVPIAEGDPDFSSVVVLLHMNGTNGSTTFTDSSGSPKAVTANGNAQISTAQSQFGGASGLFDGSGDFLSLADNIDWSFNTGNFTIEGWVRPVSISTTGELVAQRITSNTGNFWLVRLNTTGTITVAASTSSVIITNITSIPTLSINTWHHVAVVRNSGSVKIYVNGVNNDSVTVNAATAWPNVPASLYFGVGNEVAANPYNGYLDEWRITNGVARYTADFTPPTAPFPDS